MNAPQSAQEDPEIKAELDNNQAQVKDENNIIANDNAQDENANENVNDNNSLVSLSSKSSHSDDSDDNHHHQGGRLNLKDDKDGYNSADNDQYDDDNQPSK